MWNELELCKSNVNLHSKNRFVKLVQWGKFQSISVAENQFLYNDHFIVQLKCAWPQVLSLFTKVQVPNNLWSHHHPRTHSSESLAVWDTSFVFLCNNITCFHARVLLILPREELSPFSHLYLRGDKGAYKMITWCAAHALRPLRYACKQTKVCALQPHCEGTTHWFLLSYHK